VSGPPYPHPNPAPGSTGIGEFQIGISPIGTIPQFDPWVTVLSQYANSPIITSLILNLFSYVDQTQNLDAFFDLIMNLDTAQGYGLDVWGRIVGVNRVLQVVTNTWFGFAEAVPGDDGFNYAQANPSTQGGAPFYSGTNLTSNYALSDESYRTLIIAKALANITTGSVPAINKLLLTLFPNRGNCYVTDGAQVSNYFGFAEAVNASGFNQDAFYNNEQVSTMSIQYVFRFRLSAVELAIVQNSGVLPKPTGVSASVLMV
jgi:hypothetical protein